MSHHNDGVGRCDWRTPGHILDRVRKTFGGPIALDPASSPDNPTDARHFFTEKGLERTWYPSHDVFLNPPWGKGTDPIRWWVAKLVDELGAHNAQAVLVCPASMNAKWFHDYVTLANVLCFPEGRVAYDPPPGHTSDNAPSFDTAIAYFGPRPMRFRMAFEDLGWIVG